jgi:hypothetical protein
MKFAIELTCRENGQTFKDYIIETANNFKDAESNVHNTFAECGKRGLNSPDFEYFISNVKTLPEDTQKLVAA